jgi:hypothetical protein
MLRAERDLCRARLASSGPGEAATVAFAAAISRLREHSTPYHLAHGLLDQAQHLARRADGDAAVAAVEEATAIARRLHCQPLLDRAADMTSAELPKQAIDRPARPGPPGDELAPAPRVTATVQVSGASTLEWPATYCAGDPHAS